MTLVTALALLGGAVLLALALHSWWRMRRAAPRQGVAMAQPEAPQRQDPAFGFEHDTQPELPPGLRHPQRREPRLDAFIDALVPLVLETPSSGEAVLAALPSARHVGSKPFHVEGLDVETGLWEPVAAGRRFSELQAGVQMVNRHGPLNEIEYSEFVQRVEALAEAVGARADIPDMLDVVARARQLDSQAVPLDAQLTVVLRSNGVAWSVGYVQQVALRQGFVAGAVKGRWVLPAQEEAAPPLLTLAIDALAALAEEPQAAVVRECTLALDVPQTPASAEPYPAFHRAATALAEDLDAAVVDDHGEPITLHAFKAIGEELERLYRGLEQLDLAAGSAAARRLFS